MNNYEMIVVSFCLAMDAMAVAMCKGFEYRKIVLLKFLKVGLFFGFFQGLMLFFGFYLGNVFGNIILFFDKWISFILLFIIGVNMIKESFNENIIDNDDSFFKMIMLSIATSIDAFSVGLSISFLNNSIIFGVFIVSIITFILSCLGVFIGRVFGEKLGKYAEIIGGTILILLSLKIFL